MTEQMSNNNGHSLPHHTVHGVLAARIWSSLPFPPPSTSIRINSCAAAAADLQHPLKEFSVESRNKVLCAQGKIGRTGLYIIRYSQELIL